MILTSLSGLALFFIFMIFLYNSTWQLLPEDHRRVNYTWTHQEAGLEGGGTEREKGMLRMK